MIYIASPYSDPSDAMQYERFLLARNYAVSLMNSGFICFSPIAYGRQFQKQYDMGGDFETWLEFNNKMMHASSYIHVLMLPGWDKSRGVAYEIAFATRNSIPVARITCAPKESARGNI